MSKTWQPTDQMVDDELDWLWAHQADDFFRRDLDEALANEDTTTLAHKLRDGTAQDVRAEIEAIFTKYWEPRIRVKLHERLCDEQ